jgi:hypothetical protein
VIFKIRISFFLIFFLFFFFIYLFLVYLLTLFILGSQEAVSLLTWWDSRGDSGFEILEFSKFCNFNFHLINILIVFFQFPSQTLSFNKNTKKKK